MVYLKDWANLKNIRSLADKEKSEKIVHDFDDYILKPIVSEQFEQTINNWLNGK